MKISDEDRDSIWRRLSLHLSSLSEHVLTVEKTLGDNGLPSPGTNEKKIITELQTLDYLRQCLEDLAVLMHLFDEQHPVFDDRFLEQESFLSHLQLDTTKSVAKGLPTPKFGGHDKTSSELDLF